MENDNPEPTSSSLFGGLESLRTGLFTLERALNELTESASNLQADLQSRMDGDREIMTFLAAELIAARKSGIGSSKNERKQGKSADVPVPNGGGVNLQAGVGGNVPLDIFPLEVWCMILNRLSAPKDLVSCYNTSPVFRKELKPKRTEFLFEQVLPILIKNGAFFLSQLDSRLHDLRQVCHMWKLGVDSFLENHPCHYHLNDFCARASNIYTYPSSLVDCFQPNRKDRFVLGSTLKIRHFISLLEGLPPKSAGSFFIGRSIILDDSANTSGTESRPFWNAARDLLRLIGKEIWYFELRNLNPAAFGWLYYTLQLLPNLKVFQVSFRTGQPNPLVSCPPYQPDDWNSSLDLPKKLEVLKVKSKKPCPEIVQRLLKGFNLVKKLELDLYDFEAPTGGHSYLASLSERFDDVSRHLPLKYQSPVRDVFPSALDAFVDNVYLPNLEALCVPVQSKEDVMQLGKFLSSTSSIPALRSLSLVIPNCDEFSDLGLICGVLQSTLRSLSLTLKMSCFLRNLSPLVLVQIKNLLHLPGLKELTVDTGEGIRFGNIDFILPLKSLQKLTIIQRTPNWSGLVNENDSVIYFVGFQQRLYESNLWELMPALDYVLLKNNDDGICYSFCYERHLHQTLCEEEQKN